MSDAYLTLDFSGRVAAVDAVARLMAEAGTAGGTQQLSNKSLHPLNLNPNDTQEVLQCLPRLHQIGILFMEECGERRIVDDPIYRLYQHKDSVQLEIKCR